MIQTWRWSVRLAMGLVMLVLLQPNSVMAQLKPIADNTLGDEGSIVTPDQINGLPGDRISGGAQRGGNLFHSFRVFSIDEGRAAYFANPAGVENILGRVTGGGGSEILGRLGVLGEANLFLINPNGIIFGPHSSLDIGGSFLATTAAAVGFGEAGWFSAATPTAPSPLLTINPSAFFFNQMSTGDIAVRSTTPIDPALASFGLSVGVGENLALLGGDIMVEGGGLNASGGRLDLGAVEGAGTVGLNGQGGFVFPSEAQRGDVVFSEAARADVRTPEWGGEMTVTAQRISLTGGSLLRAGILSNQGSLGSRAGNIELDATDQVLVNQSSRIENEAASTSLGSPGNIEITTAILELLDGSQLSTNIYGEGYAGNMIITASDRITFQGESSYGVVSAASSSVFGEGNGAGGEIQISVPILEVLDGATLYASSFGQGEAGRVIITAHDRVLLDGVSSKRGFSSGLHTASIITISGTLPGIEGDMIITTPLLQVANGAVINARTVNAQAGGNLWIEADQMRLVGGGQVITTTENEGAAGNITIHADRVYLSGRDPTFPQRLEAFGRKRVANEGNGESGLFANTHPASTGVGGAITLNTTDLIISDGAQITAQSEGAGDAGGVTIQARGAVTLSDRSGITTSSQALGSTAGDITITTDDAIVLNNHASIRSDTSGGQGNVNLAAHRVLLQNNSTITTNASGSATGGNIDIEADFIVAVADENNDIFANAIQGSGGRVTLTAQAIYGLEARSRAELRQLLRDDAETLTPRNLSSNDVTAFSQASPNIDLGTVIFRTPDVDPSRGLVELPTVPLEVANQITQTCPTGDGRIAASAQSRFVVTGRGGLPTNPLATLEGDGILAGWATLDDAQNNTSLSPPMPTTSPPMQRPIVEAAGWSRDAAGNVVLIANSAQSPLSNSVYCHGPPPPT